MAMRLLGDRRSHPVRACILLARKAGQPLEEVKVDILRGDQFKNKELPFKKIPVLKHGDVTIAESTSILRYIATTSPNGGAWYPTDAKNRVKTDEFLDFWHSTLNPSIMNLARNKLFYKMLFRLNSPDEKAVEEAKGALKRNIKLFHSYFLQDKPFLGGDNPSIADILAAVTFDQTTLTGEKFDFGAEYMDRIRGQLDGYEELHEFALEMPETLRKMKMIS